MEAIKPGKAHTRSTVETIVVVYLPIALDFTLVPSRDTSNAIARGCHQQLHITPSCYPIPFA